MTFDFSEYPHLSGLLEDPETRILLGEDPETPEDNVLAGSHKDHPTNRHPCFILDEEPVLATMLSEFQLHEGKLLWSETQALSNIELELMIAMRDAYNKIRAERMSPEQSIQEMIQQSL